MAASEEQQLKDKQAEIEKESSWFTFQSSAKNTSSNICPKQASVKNLVGVIGMLPKL